MKYCIPFMCLFLMISCDSQKKHFNENGLLKSLYDGKRLIEEYSYQKDNPNIIAKSIVYHDDNSFTTTLYNKQGIKTRVDSNATSGAIEKRYYNGPNPKKISKREFYGPDSLYMVNFDTLGIKMAEVIQSKKVAKRLYRGNVISLHEKIYVDGVKEEWDYHPNGLLNKYKLQIQDENVDLFEFHDIKGDILNKYISVNGYYTIYNKAFYEVTKDSLLNFFHKKKEIDTNTNRLKELDTNITLDKEANYPGGKKALKKYLKNQIFYGSNSEIPQPCKSIDISLYVDKNGKAHISENPTCLHLEILTSTYKAIENMAFWKAAIAKGKPSGSTQKVSIEF